MSETQRIDVRRFIEQLDRCFDRGDMEAARDCLKSWEAEARAAGDEPLTVDGRLVDGLSERAARRIPHAPERAHHHATALAHAAAHH